MKMILGRDILRDRLASLVAQATSVNNSLTYIEGDAPHAQGDPAVCEAFGNMAVVVADMLGDVDNRLGRLDDVIREICQRSDK